MNKQIRQRMKDVLISGYPSWAKISNEEMEACLDEIDRMTKRRVKNIMQILQTGDTRE